MADASPIHVGPLTMTFRVDAADSDGSLTVFEVDVPAGAHVPRPHSHDAFEETIHVTSGEVVHHSRDLFGPGGMDLHVVRALDVERPAQINPAAGWNGPARSLRRASA